MEDNIDKYLGKYFAGEATQDENKIVEEWANQNREEFSKLKCLFDAPSILEVKDYTYDYDSAWNKIRLQLSDYQDQKVNRMPSRYVNSWISAAASVLIIGFAFVYWYGFSTVTINTAKGETKEIVLHDGSKVVLGEESSVVYKRNFKNFRNIQLDGRAFFEVVRDEEHIFTIDADDFNVQVLGTSFQVTNTENLKEVTVSSGKVSVTKNDQKVFLFANDRAILSNSSIRREVVHGSNKDAWVNRKLQFENTPLNEVFIELEYYYQVSIRVNSDENLACLVSSVYANESLESVLEELKTIFNFNYIIDGNIVTIEQIQCK